MIDPTDAIGKAREAVSARVELPGMSLMEHLDELRKRIVRAMIFLGLGFAACWGFHDRLIDFIQAPLTRDGKSLNMIHPMDGFNLSVHVALVGGLILSSPFILFQVWLFIAPGLYQKEKRFVMPFMAATVGLFLTGAYFGYYWVLPSAVHILLDVFGGKFTSVISIEEYTGFFLSIILGLGIAFELPVLIFFLALFGIVSPRFLWKNLRYAILGVFMVSAVICPLPDPVSMTLYAMPLLGLYLIGIGVAWWVHPSRRKKKEAAQ
jgi:sec-independent protein translocase protein TatC